MNEPKVSNIKPFRIQYYCERRDPNFEERMHNVLLVYRQLSIQFDEGDSLLPFEGEKPVTHVLSYDEKLGIQATATTGDNLNSTGKHKIIKRDSKPT